MDIRHMVMLAMATVSRGLVGCGQVVVCIPLPCPVDRPCLEAPPVGHPERLVPYALLPPAQQRMWRDFDEALR